MASYRLAVRRDTAANWTSADPVLAQGELGWETDTSLLKVGDGASAWSALGYYDPNPALGTGGSLVGAFKYDDGAGAPSAGRFGFDSTNPVSVTTMNISVISMNDFVWTGVADRVIPLGSQFVALQKNDTSKWIHVQVDSVFTDNTTYYTYDVSHIANGPGGMPDNGRDCVIEIIQPQYAELDNLDDVDVSTVPPVTGNVLKYDGANWVPASDIDTDLDTDSLVDLTDTTITAPVNGEVLTYNGVEWVNAGPTGGSGGGASISYVREDGFKEEPLGVATTSLVLDVPPNTFDGMLMVALVMWRTGTSNSITAPNGWTLHTDAFDDKNLGNVNQRLAIYYRVATASTEPASYTWTGTESQRMSGSITSVVGSTAIQSVTEIVTPDNDSVNKGKSLSGTAPANKITLIGGTWVYAQSASGDDCNITGDNIEYLSELGSDTSARRLHTAVSYGGGAFESFHSGEDNGAIAGSHGVVVIELDGDPIRVNEYSAPVQRDQGWRGPGQLTVVGQDALIGSQDFYFETRFWVDGSATNENVFTIGGDGITSGAVKGRILCYKTSGRGITIIHSTGGDTTSGSTIMNNALAGQIDDRFVNVIIQRQNEVVTTWLNGQRQYSSTPTPFSGFEPVNAGLHFFSYADGTTIGAANNGLVQEYRLEIAGNDNPDFVLPYDSTETTITSGLTLGFDAGLINDSTGTYIFPNLPTSDPVVAGQLWNDAGTLKVSAG